MQWLTELTEEDIDAIRHKILELYPKGEPIEVGIDSSALVLLCDPPCRFARILRILSASPFPATHTGAGDEPRCQSKRNRLQRSLA